jgi:arsenate reductase
MLHGFLNQFPNISAYSAGIEAHGINKIAIKVMNERNIDISSHASNSIEEFLEQNFDLVVTVCDHANENCPIFPNPVKKYHRNFRDPAKATGTETEIFNLFREVRNELEIFAKEIVEEIL